MRPQRRAAAASLAALRAANSMQSHTSKLPQQHVSVGGLDEETAPQAVAHQESHVSSDLEVLAPKEGRRPTVEPAPVPAPKITSETSQDDQQITRSSSVNIMSDATEMDTTNYSTGRALGAASSSMPLIRARSKTVEDTRRSPTRAASTPQSRTNTAKKPKLVELSSEPPPPASVSDDDIDDFFTRKKSTVARRKPGQAQSSSTAPATIRNDDDDDVTIMPSPTHSSSLIDTESEDDKEPDESLAHVRTLKLPAWARGDRSRIRGKLGKVSPGQNRKRRRMSVDSEDEKTRDKAESEAEVEAEQSDDSLLFDEPRKSRQKQRVATKQGSLTPPTAVPRAAVEAALAAVREHFNSAGPQRATVSPQRASSPPSADEAEDDDEALDPTLQRIRAEIASRAAARKSTSVGDVFVRHEGTPGDTSTPGRSEEATAPEELVEIRVSLMMDPDKPASDRARQAYERPIPVTCPPTDQFSTVFDRISAMRGIPLEDLVLCYRNRQVFPFGTPKSLRIIGTADFKGYTRVVWDKLEKRKERAVSQSLEEADLARPTGEQDSGDKEVDENGAPERADAALAGLLRITVRGSQTQSLGLAVKPSTSMSQLLGRYCRKFSIPPERGERMWLEFDGEQLDLTKRLEEYDEIEDEDTIDVGVPKGV